MGDFFIQLNTNKEGIFVQENVIKIFEHYREIAFIISILLNIIIAVFAVIPSFFLTAANILFFGFWKGTFLSYIGEGIGAVISFWLYRHGFKRFSNKQPTNQKLLTKLLTITGKDAFILIISLRFLPFIPSGVVTFFCAIGQVSLFTYTIASLVGKAPALFIEAYSVYQVTNWTWSGKIILAIFSIITLSSLFIKLKKRNETV